MRLTKVQRDLMLSIYGLELPCWWECYPHEKRTTDALERKGLLEYSSGSINRHISFDVRLTEKGREVSEALAARNAIKGLK